MKDKAFYMTGIELGILLDSWGIRQLCCFDLHIEEVHREKLICTLHNMAKRKWITILSDRIQPSGEIVEILRGMKYASKILAVHTEKGDALLYLGEVIAAITALERGRFRLQASAYDTLIEWMSESGLFSDVPEYVQVDQEHWENERAIKELELLQQGEISVCEKVGQIKVLDISGKEIGSRQYFLQGLLNGWILSIGLDKEIVRISTDSKETRKMCIQEWKGIGKV